MKISLKQMTVKEIEDYAETQLEFVKGYRTKIEELLGKWAYAKAEVACRRERIGELNRRWFRKLTKQINGERLYTEEGTVSIYYKTEPNFRETNDFKWEDYTLLVMFVIDTNIALDDIWKQMQGEVWSPEGEARDLIEAVGLKHTSMSVGDLIVMPDGTIHEVAMGGFNLIE